MRPLFSWQRNHVGYSHLIFLFTVTFFLSVRLRRQRRR